MTTLEASANSTATSIVSLYETSTQYKRWRYSQGQLRQNRALSNAGAVAVIKKNFEATQVCLFLVA